MLNALGLLRLVVAGLFVLMALAACTMRSQPEPSGPQASESGSHSQKAGPYANEIKAAAKKAKSQFARDVLKDGVITREEYLTAMNRYKSCMEGHGYNVRFINHHGYYTTVIAGEKKYNGQIDLQCEKGNNLYIAELYDKTVKDPSNEGPFLQVYQCMNRHGLIPPGYTFRDYKSDLLRHAVSLTYRNGAPVNSLTAAVPPPTFPYFANRDPIRVACMDNPQNPGIQPTTTG